MNRFALSYVVKSPKLTKAALYTFGTEPFQRPRMPPALTIFWKASTGPCTLKILSN